ncbi:hypothetical protein DES53_105357 [Roseimicrobium gellanilyticum]|uniref:Uncharacterized protein n=1 Tax=Roseimicrobium gellanilyticum TaxID=748857 RepID=A0A366HM09_9BACT|nr:hypothetical protein [Roseimicrobium gellanilyticum]RBP43958.1 hypothetical protein DES53_105357 [Roseimicrobium gellanilyticum]
MKASERRLLIVFLVLAAIMGGAVLSQRLLKWDHQLDRMARDLELAKMESDVLIAQAPYWKASNEWIRQAQPVAASGFDADKFLYDNMEHAARGAGFDIQKTQMEVAAQTPYYRQHGVTLTVKGELKPILEWIHATLVPKEFYLVPRLKITPDKGESQDVIATVTFLRRYSPDFASAANATSSPSPASVPPSVPAPEVGNP